MTDEESEREELVATLVGHAVVVLRDGDHARPASPWVGSELAGELRSGHG